MWKIGLKYVFNFIGFCAMIVLVKYFYNYINGLLDNLILFQGGAFGVY